MSENQKEMSEQEINAWSILVAVLKNSNKPNYSITEIDHDIYAVKDWIENGNLE